MNFESKRLCGMSLVALALCSIGIPIAAVGEPTGEIRESELAASEYLQIPDRGAVLYYQAVTKLQAGASREALILLDRCLRLHEGFDPSGSPAFKATVNRSTEWARRISELHREFPSVSRARLAFVTTEKDLVPEGLAYDSRQDAFYLSSLNRRKIVKIVAKKGVVSDFAPNSRDILLPVLGIRLDPRDGSVWANSWSEDASRSELLHFDVSGRLLDRYSRSDMEKHGFNDLVVRKDGVIILTDSLSHKVYRFDPLSKTFTTLEFYRTLREPNGIALSEDDSQLFVADDFGVVLLNLRSGISAEVNPGTHNTLAGVDGLYWHKGSLIGVQNAIGSPRIAAFRLSTDGLRVTHTTVLEYRSQFLTGEPTTGAIKGDYFYFIVNSQGDNMNGDHVADATKLEPVRIGKLRLP